MRIPIEQVSPVVDCGRYPAKAVVGERVPVEATVYREGHDALGCAVIWRDPAGTARPSLRMRQLTAGTDRWSTELVPAATGRWKYRVEAWSDPYLTWKSAVEKKIDAGQGVEDLRNDLREGAEILDRSRVPNGDRATVKAAAAALRDETAGLAHRVAPALGLADLMWRHPVKDLVTRSPQYLIWVDRVEALFGAWYEFFPRSEGGTLRAAAHRLPEIAEMGFDILYLPPVHPIGEVNRKGPNNSLLAGPDDPGSPWAIGSAAGGHDAIHPDLGTPADFTWFVHQAGAHGLRVAMDLALQCAPDHPWITEHPEWFTTRPDGTIAYAENPPKKYQDIYPLNFDNDPEGIRAEILRLVRHWIGHGVRIFRVDNPHTKPVDFWHWLIAEVHAGDPDVLFLSEAFTRPAMMHGLAKVGFSQSYTYFTWRTSAAELRQYCEELIAALPYMRPNFWVNTPDILPLHLQKGGPAMFKIRAVLASLLSPSWGMYAGYELYEHEPLKGEEYLDSEKYQLVRRNWDRPSLAPYIGRLNALRRANPALHWLRNLRFHWVDNESLLCWSKRDGDNTVLIVCTLDPHQVQWGNTALDMAALGLDWPARFTAHDELTGEEYDWGQFNAVRLDPHAEPAHVFTIRPR